MPGPGFEPVTFYVVGEHFSHWASYCAYTRDGISRGKTCRTRSRAVSTNLRSASSPHTLPPSSCLTSYLIPYLVLHVLPHRLHHSLPLQQARDLQTRELSQEDQREVRILTSLILHLLPHLVPHLMTHNLLLLQMMAEGRLQQAQDMQTRNWAARASARFASSAYTLPLSSPTSCLTSCLTACLCCTWWPRAGCSRRAICRNGSWAAKTSARPA